MCMYEPSFFSLTFNYALYQMDKSNYLIRFSLHTLQRIKMRCTSCCVYLDKNVHLVNHLLFKLK